MGLRKCWLARFGFPGGSAPPARHARGGALPSSAQNRCSPLPRAAAPSTRLRGSRPALGVALPGGGKGAGLYRFVKAADGIHNAACPFPEWPDELRPEIDIHSQEILKHQNLAVATNAGADSDCRNAKIPGDLVGEFCGNTFQHHREHAEVFKRF